MGLDGAKMTDNNAEYVPPANAITFAPHLVAEIVSGHKTATYRFGLKYDHINVGDTVGVVDSSTGLVELTIVITSKSKVQFSELPLKHDGHGTYGGIEQMRSEFSKLYVYIGREIRDDDLFLVFEFELV